MSGWVVVGLVAAVVIPAAVLGAALFWPHRPPTGRSVNVIRRVEAEDRFEGGGKAL